MTDKLDVIRAPHLGGRFERTLGWPGRQWSSVIPPSTIRMRNDGIRVPTPLLSPRFLEFRGSRQNSAPRAHVWRYGVCLGSLRLSQKPSTQTQLAIDG
jgi:hypothetical protein